MRKTLQFPQLSEFSREKKKEVFYEYKWNKRLNLDPYLFRIPFQR